jgi:hypothetical protein
MAVARVLPRLWDAPRLMRFLAGLAVMALAFAAYAGLAVPVPPPAAETTIIITTVDVPAEPVVPAGGVEQTVVTPVVLDAPDIAADEPVPAPGVDVPAGPSRSAWGSRAPPGR